MPIRNRIPDKPRYDFARKRAYQLLGELEIHSLPVDPWEVYRNFSDSWKLLNWTELHDNIGTADPFFLKAQKADAKTMLRGETYLTVYDDTVLSEGRIRWTLAHEIGHICLGHILILPRHETTGRSTLTEAQYEILEKEADCFAVNLLAPMTIMRRLDTAFNAKQICLLSKEASDNFDDERNRVLSGRRIIYPTREEDVLHRNFYNYIVSVNEPDRKMIRYDDIEIDEVYEDYIECDYWHYVCMKMLKRDKGNEELCRNLGGSLALYDDENMVVFLKEGKSLKTVESRIDEMLECLRLYADSPVKNIKIQNAKLLT